MIKCEEFFEILKSNDFTFFTGIPDSTFKDWMKYLADKDGKGLKNVVACNECEAIAIASGYHLATNKIGIVYMQNSGFGKTINPITSLCDPEVYSIPVLLMIGWRGEPGESDAPQHKKMGKIMLPLLDTLQIPYSILNPDLELIKKEIKRAIEYLKNKNGPYALIFRRNFFQFYDMKKKTLNNYSLTTKEAIELIMSNLTNDEVVIVSTTGYISRKLFEYRESGKKEHYKSFYNIGSMGCAGSIGLGIALQKPDKRIIILDGDGSAIMQMGTFTTIGKYSPTNLVHIILDNEAHESTGGQPTNSPNVKFIDIALASNYKLAILIKSKEKLLEALETIKNHKGPIAILIKTKVSSDSDLKRPERLPKEYKKEFMKYLMDFS